MTDKGKVLKWRGHDLYRCRICGFDSFDKKTFEKHFAKEHPPVQVIDGGKTEEPDVPAVAENKEASNGN